MADNVKKERPMTTGEVSQFLRYTQKTIRRMARDGVLPGRKGDKEWRFDTAKIMSMDQPEGK